MEIDDDVFNALFFAALNNGPVKLLTTAKFWARLLHLAADTRDVVGISIYKDVVVACLTEIFFAVLAASGIRDQAFSIDVIDKTANIDMAVMAVVVSCCHG